MASENERLWQKPKWSTLGKSAVKPVHDCGQRVLATDASRAWERVDALLGSQQEITLRLLCADGSQLEVGALMLSIMPIACDDWLRIAC